MTSEEIIIDNESEIDDDFSDYVPEVPDNQIKDWKKYIIERYISTTKNITTVSDQLYQEYENVVDFIMDSIGGNDELPYINCVYYAILNDYDHGKIPENFNDLNNYVLSLTDFLKEG